MFISSCNHFSVYDKRREIRWWLKDHISFQPPISRRQVQVKEALSGTTEAGSVLSKITNYFLARTTFHLSGETPSFPSHHFLDSWVSPQTFDLLKRSHHYCPLGPHPQIRKKYPVCRLIPFTAHISDCSGNLSVLCRSKFMEFLRLSFHLLVNNAGKDLLCCEFLGGLLHHNWPSEDLCGRKGDLEPRQHHMFLSL